MLKGTQIPPWLFPSGKQREQSPCSGPAQELSSNRFATTIFLYEHQTPSPPQAGRCIPSKKPNDLQAPQQAQLPWVMNHDPVARSTSSHPATHLPNPQLPTAAGIGHYQSHSFSFPSHWKKCTSPCTAGEAGRTGGGRKIPESIGLKLNLQWISHVKHWFSKLLSAQHI